MIVAEPGDPRAAQSLYSFHLQWLFNMGFHVTDLGTIAAKDNSLLTAAAAQSLQTEFTQFISSVYAPPGEEPPARLALYSAENAYVTLMSGFTTVQSIGAPSDVELRSAIARGVIPGPRLLTSITSFRDKDLGMTPEQVRDWVRKAVAQGADVIKIYATKSIREGGATRYRELKTRGKKPKEG